MDIEKYIVEEIVGSYHNLMATREAHLRKSPEEAVAPNNATCGLLRDLRMSSRNLTLSAGGVACNALNNNAPCLGETSSALSKNCN